MFDSEAEGELSETKLLEPGQWRANRTERGALTRQAKVCQGRPRQSSVTYQLAGDRGFNHFLKFSDPKGWYKNPPSDYVGLTVLISKLDGSCINLGWKTMGRPNSQRKHIHRNIPGWWFQTFLIFHNIWDNPSH